MHHVIITRHLPQHIYIHTCILWSAVLEQFAQLDEIRDAHCSRCRDDDDTIGT
jgi:hypothetical protein